MRTRGLTDMFMRLFTRLAFVLALATYLAVVQAESLSGADFPLELSAGLAKEPDNPEYNDWANLLRHSPELLGEVEYRNEPLLAGSRQNLEVRFVPGMALPIGSLVTLMAPWQSGIKFQAGDPTGPNHVTAVTTSLATLVPSAAGAPVPFASWYEDGLLLSFEVRDAEIAVGEQIEFEVSNIELPGQAGPLLLPVVFRLPGQQVMVGGPRVALTIQPNKTAQVQLDAPSRLGRNESGEAELLLQDRFGNPAIDRLPTFDVLLDGEYLQRVDPTSERTVVSGIRFEEPGRHQVEVRTGGGSLRGVSNPIIVQSGNKHIEWLDLSPGSYEFAADAIDISLLRQPLMSGGSLLELSSGTEVVSVATPYLPTDDRGLNLGTRLVQIASGDSQYEWFADRLLQAGYRLGFSAGSFSPLSPVGPNPRTGLTAVVGTEPFFDELASGSTYATTGAKMVVHTTVNGAVPGRRIKRAKEREIIGWIQGTGPLDRIELVKNGEVIAEQALARTLESKVLRVSVKSSSEPFRDQRDLPRNGREWIGFVRSSGAALELVSAPGFRNPTRQGVAQNGLNRVDFITWTHGSSSSFMVQLGDTSDDEVIELNLRAGQEDGDIKPALRAPAQIPPARVMIPYYELENGPVTRFIEVAGYQDEVRFELVNPESPDYAEFRFTDASAFAEEDYYYVRILQLDDHVAWSSPVFVGGFDLQ